MKLSRSRINVCCRLLCATSALAAAIGFSPCSQAALGEDVDSVAADQVRLQAQLQVVHRPNHTIHEMQVPTGGNIREFVADSGKVFAVSWSGG